MMARLRISLLAFLGAWFLRSFHWSYRWKISSSVPLTEIDAEPWVFAFWHDSLLMMPGLRFQVKPSRGFPRPVTMLTSRHGDGQIIARAIRHLGLHAVSGSSSRGGAAGLRGLIKAWQRGSHVGITPDGPKGPRHECKVGVIALAAQTSQKVYPIAIVAERGWRFKSWDKMCLPKPFSRLSAVIGDPLAVAAEHSAEELHALTAELTRRLDLAETAAQTQLR